MPELPEWYTAIGFKSIDEKYHDDPEKPVINQKIEGIYTIVSEPVLVEVKDLMFTYQVPQEHHNDLGTKQHSKRPFCTWVFLVEWDPDHLRTVRGGRS